MIGFEIGSAILCITGDAVKAIWYRLMDAVDPELVDQIDAVAAGTVGVEAVSSVRVRWVGHALYSDVRITVNEDLRTRDSHEIAEAVHHALFHDCRA